MSLKQSGSVESYHEQFELHAGPLRSPEPEYLKGIFLSGLKDIIKAELKLHPISSLPELMHYAQCIDEKNTLLSNYRKGTNRPTRTFKTYSSTCTIPWEPNSKNIPPKNSTNLPSNETNPNSTLITVADLSNGSLMQRCKTNSKKVFAIAVMNNLVMVMSAHKQLYILLVEDGPMSEEPTYDVLTITEDFHKLQLSMFSISGFTSIKTIKLWG